MSNKTQGKLAFNVSKSDNKSGVHNAKPTIIRSSITQHDSIKNNSFTPVKRNSLTTVTKRKRKSTETTNTKNQTITQFFTPSKPTNATTTRMTTTDKSNNNNNNNSSTEATSSSIQPQTPFSSKSVTTSALSTSLSEYDDMNEESVICYIRNIHSVKEIWTSIVGEYGEETPGDCIRRVRPRIEERGSVYYDDEDEEVLLLNEDNMIRPIRCKMSVQESLDFFEEITNEFLCV